MLTVDGIAVATTIVGHAGDQDVVRGVGMGAAVVGAPLVHLVRSNPRGALKSLALRVTLPVALGWGMSKLVRPRICFEPTTTDPSTDSCGHDEERIQTGHVIGFVAGIVVASAIDSAAFAKEPKSEWQPTLAIVRGGAQLGFAATF